MFTNILNTIAKSRTEVGTDLDEQETIEWINLLMEEEGFSPRTIILGERTGVGSQAKDITLVDFKVGEDNSFIIYNSFRGDAYLLMDGELYFAYTGMGGINFTLMPYEKLHNNTNKVAVYSAIPDAEEPALWNSVSPDKDYEYSDNLISSIYEVLTGELSGLLTDINYWLLNAVTLQIGERQACKGMYALYSN